MKGKTDEQLEAHFEERKYHDWDKVVKKEARGINDYDLGEVEEVDEEHVITKKGVVDKDRFYIPKNKVHKFDGDKLWLEVTKDEAKTYRRD